MVRCQFPWELDMVSTSIRHWLFNRHGPCPRTKSSANRRPSKHFHPQGVSTTGCRPSPSGRFLDMHGCPRTAVVSVFRRRSGCRRQRSRSILSCMGVNVLFGSNPAAEGPQAKVFQRRWAFDVTAKLTIVVRKLIQANSLFNLNMQT